MKKRTSTLIALGRRYYIRQIRPRLQPLLSPFTPWHLRLMAVGVVLILIGFLLPQAAPKPDVTLRHIDPPAILGTTGETQGTWHIYHIAAGQTLAQLFRDEGLPTESLYAMTKVQGSDKPLGTLSAGQEVKIRMTSKDDVTGLTLENRQQPVLFVKQEDGRFLRVQ